MYVKQQNAQELLDLIQIFIDEGVKSYLEIGSRFGGSLWAIANMLPYGSKIVSVDKPHDDHGLKSLRKCVAQLKTSGYDCTLILGDSTDPGIIAKVRSFAPFDACVIDGNHTLPYVTSDWTHYSPMARIVALHDISWKGPRPGRLPVEVPLFWPKIKQHYRHREIQYEPRDNGFGVIWM